MAANAQVHPPVQQQQQLVVVQAPVAQPAPHALPPVQPKPTRVSLSYEEISKLFSLPIAEAASILGNHARPVSSSELAGIPHRSSRSPWFWVLICLQASAPAS